ncbi:MAG: response regulator [Deltaproteobacteria bacterium]|nr:response regulator [Deltaproteobacteria bacterium]
MDILSEKNDIDLVIADLRMPGMSGDEFIIKAHEKFPDLKYIIQTGTIDYVPDQRLQDAGVTSEYVLAKPVLRLHTYVDLIEKLLGS